MSLCNGFRIIAFLLLRFTSQFKSFTRIMRNMWKTNLDVAQHRYQKESLVTLFLNEALKPREPEPDALERD